MNHIPHNPESAPAVLRNLTPRQEEKLAGMQRDVDFLHMEKSLIEDENSQIALNEEILDVQQQMGRLMFERPKPQPGKIRRAARRVGHFVAHQAMNNFARP